MLLGERGAAGRRGRGPRLRPHGTPVAVTRSEPGSLGAPIPQRGLGRGQFELRRGGGGGARARRACARRHHARRGAFLMRTTAELGRAAQEAFELARAQADVSEVEVFAAANGSLLTRLNYTSHIPCNGVGGPKSGEGC